MISPAAYGLFLHFSLIITSSSLNHHPHQASLCPFVEFDQIYPQGGFLYAYACKTICGGERRSFLILGGGRVAGRSRGWGVQVRFGIDSPSAGPFPSNLFTVPDTSQNTGLRVNLPKPDCAVRVSDCRHIDVINTLDGFNLQPRLSIPFTGPIDVNTVTSETVFLLRLGRPPQWKFRGQVIGINQVVWDPETNTLHVESDELLEQHTRYALSLLGTASRNPVGSGPLPGSSRFAVQFEEATPAYRLPSKRSSTLWPQFVVRKCDP